MQLQHRYPQLQLCHLKLISTGCYRSLGAVRVTCAIQVELGPAKKAAELAAADTPCSTPSTGASSRR